MKPVPFFEQNNVYAENQPQYQPLPVHKTADGEVISCWRLSIFERVRVLFTGRIWFRTLTFNEPLQPQGPCVEYPFVAPTQQHPEKGCG